MVDEQKTQPVEPAGKFAAEFEEEVRSFLRRMGFTNVTGGIDYKVGGIQIDALATYGNTAIVVECTGRRGRGQTRLHDRISEVRGEMRIIEDNAKTDPVLDRCTEFRYLLATNVVPSQADVDFASQEPHVVILDKRAMTHYSNLASIIPGHAIYNLLGELEVPPDVSETITMPAFSVQIGNTVLFSFFARPSELLKFAYVARREVGHEQYYQRMVKKSRLKSISEYVASGEGIFPNGVVLSFTEAPRFTELGDVKEKVATWPSNTKFGYLQFPKSYRSCWVVDGQHRLFGLGNLPDGISVPVVAFQKLDPVAQAKYFLDINSKQQRVEPDLLWDLRGQLMPTETMGIVSLVAKKLDRQGPLAGKIYIPLEGPKGDRKVKLAGICNTMWRIGLVEKHTSNMRGGLDNPLVGQAHTATVERTSKFLTDALSVVDKRFSTKSKDGFWFDNSGLSVTILLTERILAALEHVPNPHELDSYFSELVMPFETSYSSEPDLAGLRRACSSDAGRSSAADDFAYIINSSIRNNLPPLPVSERAKHQVLQFIEIESKLRQLIARDLKQADANWIKRRVPPDVLDAVRKKKLEEGEEQWEMLDLGMCAKILEMKMNWPVFEKYFVKGKWGFSRKETFFAALAEIKDRRDPSVHDRRKAARYGDAEIIRGYIKKLTACLDNALGIAL